ncbi:probable pectinesterase/pectinesterase inhibitor 41 [Triticum dicoccoides]|uniref:probable pectinesterase/pectinesterase inhibitor 41 n=1 Tax=Triticum dicoccoides TaxID=85692 RepID=UPI000E792D62|nr:probable pectinesterase/pectinesterase inhibitor 41 [Triticum dicoccoides]
MALYYGSALSAVLLLSLLVLSLSDDAPPSTPVSPSTACNDTTDPTFCRTVLPPHGTSDLYTYGRFSVAKSLASANKFVGLVDRYLSRHRHLSRSAIGALQDCKLLSELNVDFLSATGTALQGTETLLDPQADDVQTLLSAILTNQETCLDGLQAASGSWSDRGGGLAEPISNGTKLYSLSLSLFTRAWVPTAKAPKGAKKPHHGHKKPPAAPAHARRGLFDANDVEMVRRMAIEGPQGTVAVNRAVTVDQGGSGNYTTVGNAVAAAPTNLNGSAGYYVIYVLAGVYEENVEVPKKMKYVMMIGDGIGQTVITGNRSVVDGWTTFHSATVAVHGQGFVAMNMTIRNTAGPAKHQAVALRSSADLSTFYSCSFEAYQDTLYTHSLRQFYRGCEVHGTVDYVFGNAAVVFQDCTFYSRLPMQGQSNTVTAQGRTNPEQNTGTSIQGCTLLPSPELAANAAFDTRTFLGRPWKNYSRTVVMESYIGGLVDATGWMPWSGDFALGTLYYAEYNNSGPGADTGRRVTWPGYHVLGDGADAGNFTVDSMVLGGNWLPQTGVPFTSGLKY